MAEITITVEDAQINRLRRAFGQNLKQAIIAIIKNELLASERNEKMSELNAQLMMVTELPLDPIDIT